MKPIIENVWNKSKMLVKGLMIGLLALLLLIPTAYVQNLIAEREARQKEAIAEVSSKWAGRQNIAGPVLVIPYTRKVGDSTDKVIVREHAYFLPDELTINADVKPQQRYRGIYKVMLYSTQVQIAGNFKNIDLQKLNIPVGSLLWHEAYIIMNLSDPKGLNDELKVKWNDSVLTLSPQMQYRSAAEGMMSPISLTSEGLNSIQFSSSFSINGSEQLLFTPVGKTTNVNVRSSWPHPSFSGSSLPQSSSITADGFAAEWKSRAHKRNFPQQWTGASYIIDNLDDRLPATPSVFNLAEASFGINLFIPVNNYQKAMRSVKYAILCILLTFAAFFLIDTIYRKSVHAFQYGLIGLALVLFYVLLLSFSEYIGFNMAYALAACATIGLIGWFVKGLLASGRLSILLSSILLLVYGYIFTILQLQDYALLLGSIGLFITLAIIMYFSRKIQW